MINIYIEVDTACYLEVCGIITEIVPGEKHAVSSNSFESISILPIQNTSEILDTSRIDAFPIYGEDLPF